MTHFTQQQIEEMLEGISPDEEWNYVYDGSSEWSIGRKNDPQENTIVSMHASSDSKEQMSKLKLVAAAPALAKQLLDVMVKLQAAEEKLKVVEDTLEYYSAAFRDNWGNKAREALAVIRGEKI